MPNDVIIAMANKNTMYCLDFKSFDSSLSSGLIRIVWNIIGRLFRFRDRQDIEAFEFCEYLFQNNPIIMPDGRIWIVHSGLPSGSYFTQVVGSIANLVMLRLMQLHFLGFCPKETHVLGDDSIFAVPREFASIDQLSAFYSQYGLTINIEKSIITNKFPDVHFLGHNFYGSRVTREEFQVLQLSLYPENEVTSAAQSIVRIASILLDSGFNSKTAYHLYSWLLYNHPVNWDLEENVPVSLSKPFVRLFKLS
jgi:hypothetical protein